MGGPVSKGKTSRNSDACHLGLYLIFLFGTIPVMPQLWKQIARLGRWHRWIPEGIGILLILSTLRVLIRQKTAQILLKGLLFVLLAIVFVLSMDLVKRPVERIHFSEYGFLAFLLFRFLRHRDSSRRTYGLTVIGVWLIGFLDEAFQGLLPNRVYDPRDLWFNGVAGILGLCTVILLFDPFFAR